MPFLRLIAIYAFVALAVFTVFNRDEVLPLIGLGDTKQAEDLPPIPAEMPEGDDAAPVTDNADGLPPIPTAPEKMAEEAAVAPAAPAEGGTDMAASTAPPLQATAPAATDAAAPKEVSAAATGNGADDMDAQLSAARKAFWSGDSDAAEKIYLQLIATHPDNADLRGELGNLYYNTARPEDAARLYFEAGKILRDTGREMRLGAVVAALRGIRPDLAAKLAPATPRNN